MFLNLCMKTQIWNIGCLLIYYFKHCWKILIFTFIAQERFLLVSFSIGKLFQMSLDK